MKIEATADAALVVEFESEAELRAEQRANLAVGGLMVHTAARFPMRSTIDLTLRLSGGGATTVRAQVVATPPGALALHLEADPGEIVAKLCAAPDDGPNEDSAGTLWESMRELSPPQKILLAPKADRATRAVLVQESDPQVLFALLRNPRLSLDEVIRIAKSSFLSFQAAELILKTGPWFSNLDVRLALIHNAKVPLPFALRILPTLPDGEVRRIAKGAATSMPLKQAALRRVTGD